MKFPPNFHQTYIFLTLETHIMGLINNHKYHNLKNVRINYYMACQRSYPRCHEIKNYLYVDFNWACEIT